MPLNRSILGSGQFGCVVTPSTSTVPDAQSAGMTGLVVKRLDGTTTAPWATQYADLATTADAAGLDVIPWVIVYPDDPGNDAWWPLLTAAIGTSKLLILEPVMNQWLGQVAASRALWQGIRQRFPGLTVLYFTWGDPSMCASFPWPTWNAACAAVVPEIYPGTYQLAPDRIYNIAFLGGLGAGPGIEEMAPQPPAVVPCFDLSAIAACSALAKQGAFPAVVWFALDSAVPESIAQLAATPYATIRVADPATTPAAQSPSDQALAEVQQAQQLLAEAAAELNAPIA